MLRPLLQPAAKRLILAKWQLAAALVASTIPAFAQVQITEQDIVVNHDVYPVAGGPDAGIADGPVGGEFAFRAKVQLNGGVDAGTVTNVELVQNLPIGSIFAGLGTLPTGVYSGPGALPAGVTCAEPLPKMGEAIDAKNAIIKCSIDALTSSVVEVDFRVVLPKVGTEWKAFASASAPNNIDPDDTNHFDIGRLATSYESADLAVKIEAIDGLAHPVDTVLEGSTIRYKVTVSNNKSDYSFPFKDKEIATVWVPEPTNGTFDQGGVVSPGWTCTYKAKGAPPQNGMECTFNAVGDIAPGKDLGELLIPMRVDLKEGNIEATASVSAGTETAPKFDVHPENNISKDSIQVLPNLDMNMVLTKSVAPSILDLQKADASGYSPVTYTFVPKRASGIAPPGKITVTDDLPANVEFADADFKSVYSGTGWTCDIPEPVTHPRSFECVYDAALKNNGETEPLTIKAKVLVQSVFEQAAEEGIAASSVKNTAIVMAETEPDESKGDNQASAVVTVKNTVDLGIAKKSSVPVVESGKEFYYDITVSNNDQFMDVLPGQTITVIDQLDGRLAFNGVDVADAARQGWSCDVSDGAPHSTRPGVMLGQKLTCTYSGGLTKKGQAIVAGDPPNSTVLRIKVTPYLEDSENPFATITNTADLTGVGGRDNSGVISTRPSDASVNLSEKVADLSIKKTGKVTAGSSKYGDKTSGAEVVYTLEVQNLPLPDDLESQKAQTVQVTDVVTNLITKGVAEAAGVTAYVDETQQTKYTKMYIKVQAFKPGADTPLTDVCEINGSGYSNTATVTCKFSGVEVSAKDIYKVEISARQYVDAKSITDGSNVIPNTAKVYSPDTAEFNTKNNEDTFEITLDALTDLSVTKTSNPTDTAAAAPIVYTLTTSNSGPSKADNVKLVDQLPVGAIWVGGYPTAPGAVCKLSGGADFKAGLVLTASNNTLTCEWAQAFGANSGYDVTYQLRSASQNYPLRLDNAVDVTTETKETRTDNNHDENSVTLSRPEVDVLVNMRHSEDGLHLETGSTQYRITVTNSGASKSYATNVNMTNQFHAPGSTAKFSFVSLDKITGDGRFNAQDNCKVLPSESEAEELVCDFPWLAVGESVDIWFTMKPAELLNGRPVGTINHSASVSADVEYLTNGGELANNQTTDRTSTYDPTKITVPVEDLRFIDLSLKKEADAPVDGIAVGSTITYRLIVTNEEDPAVNPPLHLRNGSAVVTDKLPEGLELDGTAPAGCDYDQDTRTLVCTVTELDAGAFTTFEFSVTVKSLAPSQTSVLNKALLTSPGDPVEPNNEDEEEVPVGEVDLSLVKSVDKKEAKVGDALVYSLLVTNHGPMNSTGAVVTDLWPEELQFVSADDACQLDAGEVRCDVGELANGASKTFQLSAIVGDAASAMMVTNVAKVKAPGDKKPENDESTTTTEVPEESPGTDWPEEKPEPEVPEEKPTPTPVPTMGTAGLVLMSLMVAGLAGLRQRRRR